MRAIVTGAAVVLLALAMTGTAEAAPRRIRSAGPRLGYRVSTVRYVAPAYRTVRVYRSSYSRYRTVPYALRAPVYPRYLYP